ncbi:unnamed protein product [Mytilus coruscus]|uniref:Uncharacterized protein n=1 Tax=Mytilus coruscus TaxID=42192 RepID=A0A6J8B7A1_MYTCO|nr:unnamed protein product [Mytilus coruscus]
MASKEEKKIMVREFREIFHGRFDAEDTRRIFEHLNWDKNAAVNFVLKNEAKEVRKLTSLSEDVISELKTDPEVIEALQDGVKSIVRQFACEQCDNVWWWRVPIRKQVSKCRKCKQKYDPIPRENEWGWAAFDCNNCGKRFSAHGEMNVTICRCYKCGNNVRYPTCINHGRVNKRNRRSGSGHSCEAEDCTSRHHVPIHEVDEDRVYDEQEDDNLYTAAGGENSIGIAREVQNLKIGSNPGVNQKPQKFKCLSPETRMNKKRVIHSSPRHLSTGSTVGTFLPQDDIASTYVPSLSSIREERGQHGCRGRGGSGRNGRGGRGGRR